MKLYICPDFDARLTIGLDHLLHAKATCEAETFGFIGNPDRLRMGMGTGLNISTFDMDKLKGHGVHVDRRPYHGSGFVSGPRDVTFSIHQNHLAMTKRDGGPDKVFCAWQDYVCRALNELDANVQVKRYKGPARDQACVNLTGKSEIVDSEGHKVVASIYRDDGMVFSMGGTVLIGTDWARIYDYMNQPMARLNGYCLADSIPQPHLTDAVIVRLSSVLPDVEPVRFTPEDYRIAAHMAERFKVL